MEGDGEQSEEIEYDNDGDPIPRLSSGTERQRGDDDANVPDTLSWTAAAAAPPGEQPTATGFGLFAGPSTTDPEAAAAFLEAVATPVPEHIRAALAGGLLADAYAAAAADPPPPDAASATAPRTHAAAATPLPADLRWPCAEELGVTAAVSELAAAGGAASVQQVDARLPPFSLEMQSACGLGWASSLPSSSLGRQPRSHTE